MSGGSFDYLYFKVEEMADQVGIVKSKEEIEFANFIRKVAKLMHSIEWAYSGDTSIEDFKKDWKSFKKELIKESSPIK